MGVSLLFEHSIYGEKKNNNNINNNRINNNGNK